MPKFSYIAKDKDAHPISGTLEVKDAAAAVRELKSRKLTVISVSEAKEESKTIFSKGKIRPMDLVVFARQLATLIDSGVSLLVGLGILYQQVENPYLKKIVSNLKSDIEAGNSLSGSFAKYPTAFSSIFVNMVRAGESSGSLNEILDRVADYLEKAENLRRKVMSSLTYPVLIVCVAAGIIAFLMLKVVPAFKGIFTTLGGELPLPTQILIVTSDVSVKFFPFIVLGAILLYTAFFRYVNTAKGRYNFDGWKLKVPIFGVIINKVAIGKFTRTLATLVKSGVNILEAFDVASKVTGNKVIELASDQVKRDVQAGENISDPMERTGKFPIFVVKMIAIGEQTGELEKMLTKISEYYETQVNDSLSSLTSMIEPVIISFLGVSIGFIVVAMFLPVFKLTQLITK